MIPLVSIIIPTFNRALLIGETLESIINQTYQNWECIVVDDGSRDYTKELMEFYCSKDKRITYYKRPADRIKGPSSCRNFGFEISKGSYINWIDSDDILFPDAIEKKLGNIGNNDVIISSVRYIDDMNRPIELIHQYFSPKNLIEDYFFGKITFYTITPLWSRTFLEKQSELFDENISNLDDWDFNLRMLYQNPKLCYLHEPLILYRLHPHSLSKEISKLNFKEIQSEFRARNKHIKLLKYSDININRFRFYDKEKCRIKLRAALTSNHPVKLSLLLMLIKRQIKINDFKGMAKTTFGYLTITLFKKGNRLLK